MIGLDELGHLAARAYQTAQAAGAADPWAEAVRAVVDAVGTRDAIGLEPSLRLDRSRPWPVADADDTAASAFLTTFDALRPQAQAIVRHRIATAGASPC